MAAHLRHGDRGNIEIGTDQIAPFLGFELCRYPRRTHQIAEHHCEIAALAGGWSGSWWCCGALSAHHCFRAIIRAQRRDSIEQLAAVPERGNAKLFQVLSRQARKNRFVNLVFAECSLILSIAARP